MPNLDHPPSRPDRISRALLAACTLALCCSHLGLLWRTMDGLRGLTNGWPPWKDDHPLYFHSALVTRHFLRQTGTTAGYDPAFMAGYPKSVVFPASSTLPEVCVALAGGSHPVEVYKGYVLVSAALIPWLIWLSARLWRVGPGGAYASVALFLVYVWTDFPMRYAEFGMLPYLLAIPLGLAATGVFCHYCEKGTLRWWLVSTFSMTLMVMTHFTSAMIVAPAVGLVYLASLEKGKTDQAFPHVRHLGVWSVPVVVVVLNAFWWFPALWLTGTKGTSDFVFTHPEGVLRRLWQIATTESRIEPVVVVLGLAGLALMWASILPKPRAVGLLAFVAAGFFWGYLSGELRSLDFLQPGRHTFAFFSGLTVAAGFGVSVTLRRLREHSRFRLDVLGGVALVAAGIWYLGPDVDASLRRGVFAKIPFLSSRPSPWLRWVFKNVRKHVKPGERLLYEEGGFAVEGVPDPFQGGRFSGLLADALKIELIGGPYLHASLTTNFTQFGEGRLFGKTDWDRDWFVRYARLYRPSAILCWTPKSREFCLANPDLIDVKADDGTVLFGRVLGFEGATISGKAEVSATPGRLTVTKAEGGVDGTVVLRYHSVPCLRPDPPVDWGPVYLEGDPVPFIRMKPPPGGVPVTFSMKFPPAPFP